MMSSLKTFFKYCFAGGAGLLLGSYFIICAFGGPVFAAAAALEDGSLVSAVLCMLSICPALGAILYTEINEGAKDALTERVKNWLRC